jgi:spore germination cell wall hydrolase CwlJ-like protein
MMLSRVLITLAVALSLYANAHARARPVPRITANNIDVGAHYLGDQNEQDIKCLAYSIYREAGNQSDSAQMAVGQVHVNRAREGTWGHHLCRVVFAPAQFSWTNERREVRWTPKQYAHFMDMAGALVTGVRVRGLDSTRILHYHTLAINKKWDKQGKAVAVAGAHIFFADIPH